MLEKIRLVISGKKTYFLAVAALITSLVAWATGGITLGEFITATFASLGALFMRAGIAKSEPYEIE